MPRFRTHYDHLKVAENASIEDIRAAFKIYFLKFHPHKYAGNRQRAEQVMRIVSEAYSILSNPEKRAGYDAWIAQNRQIAAQELNPKSEQNQGQTLAAVSEKIEGQNPQLTPPEINQTVADTRTFGWKLPVLAVLLGGLVFAGWLAYDNKDFQTSVIGSIISSPDEGYGFVFGNNCRHPITLVVRYKGLDESWYIDGWWDVGSGESFYLEDENGNRLTSRDPVWYYYARTTNDANIEWKGRNRFTYSGARLAMIEIEDAEGDSEWSISCD